MAEKINILLVAVITGVVFNYIGVPAGGMIGAMLGTAAIQIRSTSKLVIPIKIRRLVRISMGTFIGLGITAQGIAQVRNLLLPAVISLVGIISISLLTVLILYKIFKFPLAESLLSSIPAGLSELSMNAEEIEADPVVVTTMHIFRLFGIFITIPILIKILH
ncbi:MAG: hypothetical protein VR72_00625 [Clostridiaceae bacterium BRH_c20a]|nr:MAG: hypothetical protein VR72_00625 [Clostridiaceae bacterium BRH_c20a]